MPMFDPVTGKVTDPDALRSLQFNGKGMRIPRSVVRDGNKVTEIVDQYDGTTVGVHTEHPSGRLDANVFPKAVKAGISNQPQEA